MGLEKQTKSLNSVSLGIEWPDPPKAITVAGQQVIGYEEFTRWLDEFSLAMGSTLESTSKEIESLKSVGK